MTKEGYTTTNGMRNLIIVIVLLFAMAFGTAELACYVQNDIWTPDLWAILAVFVLTVAAASYLVYDRQTIFANQFHVFFIPVLFCISCILLFVSDGIFGLAFYLVSGVLFAKYIGTHFGLFVVFDLIFLAQMVHGYSIPAAVLHLVLGVLLCVLFPHVKDVMTGLYFMVTETAVGIALFLVLRLFPKMDSDEMQLFPIVVSYVLLAAVCLAFTLFYERKAEVEIVDVQALLSACEEAGAAIVKSTENVENAENTEKAEAVADTEAVTEIVPENAGVLEPAEESVEESVEESAPEVMQEVEELRAEEAGENTEKANIPTALEESVTGDDIAKTAELFPEPEWFTVDVAAIAAKEAEEAAKRAEDEAREKAEEEARKAEEARKKAEEEAKKAEEAYQQLLSDITSDTAPLLACAKAENKKLFSHLQEVAELSFEAADVISANPLLAMAGGYYHEIGKLRMNKQANPVSNQVYTETYIENGLRLADEANLPEQVKALIREHNVKYHLPQSPEAVVVMLTDTIITTIQFLEASAPGKVKTDKVVSQSMHLRLTKGDLNESGLTMTQYKDLYQFYVKYFQEKK